MKKPIAVAEVKEGDFVRLGNDGHYDTLTIDDGDRVSTARFEPGSTVWLVTP